MNTKNLLLGTFVALTLVFASLTLIEYQQVSTLTLQVQASQSKPASTVLSFPPFPRNESDISQFCKFGALVGSVLQQQTQNASGQTITTIFRPVLMMQTSSTAYACVTYQSLYSGPEAGFQGALPLAFSFSLSVCHKIGQTGIECSASHALSGSAFPSQVTLTPSMSNFTVVYTVTVPAGSTGFYDSTGDTAWGYPLAVGYQNSQLNASDFHIVLSGHPGGEAQPIRAISVNVIGMSWTYVEFQCSPDPPPCISGN
jgi:hypothetical protein